MRTLARVDTLCLDKTGTITEGTMCVERVEPWTQPEKAQGVTEQNVADGERDSENSGTAAERAENPKGNVAEISAEIQPAVQNAPVSENNRADMLPEAVQDAGEQQNASDNSAEIKKIENIMCSLMYVLKDENATADALRKRFPARETMKAEHVIPFSSDRKYSGAVFCGRGHLPDGSCTVHFPGRE